MLANTITLTVNTVDKVLARISESPKDGSNYLLKSATEKFQMKIRHSTGSRGGVVLNRHNIYVEHTTFATATEAEKYRSFSLTLSELEGTDPDTLEHLTSAVNTAFSTLFDDVIGGQQ